MATQDEDKKLQILNAATKELESDDNLAFDDVVRLCVQELKEWPPAAQTGLELNQRFPPSRSKAGRAPDHLVGWSIAAAKKAHRLGRGWSLARERPRGTGRPADRCRNVLADR